MVPRIVSQVDFQTAGSARLFQFIGLRRLSAFEKPFLATVQQSKLLHPLVDEVYAFGIGRGSNVNELKEIASDSDNWAVMDDFIDYENFIRIFMLAMGGCQTRQIQPYRIIDLATPDYALSYGASSLTTDQYPELECSGYCPEYPEYGREFECAQCSAQIAALDLEAMEVFRHNITEAAKVGFRPHTL